MRLAALLTLATAAAWPTGFGRAALAEEPATHTHGAGGDRVLAQGPHGVIHYISPEFELHDGIAVSYLRIGRERVARLVNSNFAARIHADLAPDGRITAGDAWLGRSRGVPVDRILLSSARRLLFEIVTRTTWFGHDHLDGITVETDERGGVIGRRSYAPFGATASSMGDGDRRGFTNQESDHDGMLHFQFRTLDPMLGRWTSPDPLFKVSNQGNLAKLGESNSPYSYVANNPASFKDPTGLLRTNSPSKEKLVDPMPQVQTQIDLGLLLMVNLNCGWYSANAVVSYWSERLTGERHHVALPGMKRAGYGWAVGDHTNWVGQHFTEVDRPRTLMEWGDAFDSFGPMIASGKLGAADWGPLGGVAHDLVLVGVRGNKVNEAPTHLAYVDPLDPLGRVKWRKFRHMMPRMRAMYGLDQRNAKTLLGKLGTRR